MYIGIGIIGTIKPSPFVEEKSTFIISKINEYLKRKKQCFALKRLLKHGLMKAVEIYIFF